MRLRQAPYVSVFTTQSGASVVGCRYQQDFNVLLKESRIICSVFQPFLNFSLDGLLNSFVYLLPSLICCIPAHTSISLSSFVSFGVCELTSAT